jgi:Serine dehydrogenase proteinase
MTNTTKTKPVTERWAELTGNPTLFLLATGSALNDEMVSKVARLIDGKTFPAIDLCIATEGGLGASAFRLTSILRRHITNDGALRAIVVSDCFSAGTIAVLGCDEILTSDLAVLGPIDPQRRSRDAEGNETWHSALDLEAGLREIQEISLESLDDATALIGTRGNLPVEQAANFGVEFSAALTKALSSDGVDMELLGGMSRVLGEARDFGAAQLRRSYPDWKDEHYDDVLELLIKGFGSHSYPLLAENLSSLGLRVTPLEGEAATLGLDLAELASTTEVIEFIEREKSA